MSLAEVRLQPVVELVAAVAVVPMGLLDLIAKGVSLATAGIEMTR